MISGSGVTVWNKCDLPWPAAREGLSISARTGQGLESLLDVLREQVRARLEAPRESPPMTRARHRECVGSAAEALARALDQQETELRDFCIGK